MTRFLVFFLETVRLRLRSATVSLAEHFDTSRQAVSKHLRILTECELVTQEQKGREIYYSLEIEKMKEIDKWLEQYRKIWETRLNQLEDLLATIKKEEKEK